MIELKYKVGDQVLVKDLDWYNKNKNENDEVIISALGPVFTRRHSKYAGKVMTVGIVSKLGFYVLKEDKEGNRWYDEMFDTLVEAETKPKYEDEVNVEYYSTPKYLVRPNGYQFVDENGNVINTHKIVLEKKKKEYPKIYEECCKVLNTYCGSVCGYNWKLLLSFQQLLICRDAYWKIAGEEMGLNGPWEPDWNSGYFTPAIIYRSGFIQKVEVQYRNAILVFPTKEMRDTFYENFKSEIEICKKLL